MRCVFLVHAAVALGSKLIMCADVLQMTSIAWDHANSEVKMSFRADDNYVIITLQNSVEFEGEMKLRLSAAASSHRGMKIPSPMYIGMFAGAHKPKPFQRKRPNLSYIPASKLPTLHDMRNTALDLHRGSYRPCPQGESRRLQIALQHIYEGYNTFALINVRGASNIANQFRGGSVLLITDDCLVFKPRGEHSDTRVEFPYDDISEWDVEDNDNRRLGDSGISVHLKSGETVFFGVDYIRDVKHTLEYFWNTYKVSSGLPDEVKLGSTHGRPIVSAQTLSGEVPPPEAPIGQIDVVDQDGIVVRPGGKIAPRRGSVSSGVLAPKEPSVVPLENRNVKKHWHKVVMHQGWLLKQGGVGIGSNKSWIKRYFVLYKTSQGHFLVYYSDFTECPMYTSEKNHRNIVDLAKATFIRPGSNKQDNPDTPPYCFDIVTTEREWTLCAESQENVQRWLKLLTRAVDEDVAILPDEELIFKVKPKSDPVGILPANDYSTELHVSSLGVAVTAPDLSTKDSAMREHYFWVYTDFYKWSLVCPGGKYALMVNVFADSSFSRRMEYAFRTKEAHRLATAIEFYIEKFMSIMHMRLELADNAAEEIEAGKSGVGQPQEEHGGGLHIVAEEDREQGYNDSEVNLLEMDDNGASAHTPVASAPAVPAGGFSSDPFGDADPFGEHSAPARSAPAPAAPAPAPAPKKTTDALLDLFDAPAVPVSAPAPQPAAAAHAASADPFGSDPFGSDPFGGDFGAVSVSGAHAPRLAPPLTAQQVQQHRTWFLSALGSGSGPVYNDGTLQVAAKVEVRGSQARVTLSYTNASPASITELKVTLDDAAGLLRSKVTPVQETIAGLGSAQQVIMAECMKPAAPGPQITIEYNDTLQGKRNNTIPFPLLVTSFNEPLATLSPADFQTRWNALSQPGQEVQQVLRPSYPVVPSQIHNALSTVSPCLLCPCVCSSLIHIDSFRPTDAALRPHQRPARQHRVRRLRRLLLAHRREEPRRREHFRGLHVQDRDECAGERAKGDGPHGASGGLSRAHGDGQVALRVDIYSAVGPLIVLPARQQPFLYYAAAQDVALFLPKLIILITLLRTRHRVTAGTQARRRRQAPFSRNATGQM